MPRRGPINKLSPNYVPPVPGQYARTPHPGIAKANAEAEAARGGATHTTQASVAERDLAAEFAPPVPTEAQLENRFQKGNKGKWGLRKDPATGKMVPGIAAEGHGTAGAKKGNRDAAAVKSIKDFVVELLDDEHYRMTLTRRIKAGELPSVELFLLTKALGKPKEEIEITANVPLFSLPTSFVLKEDVVEPESVKLIEEGAENGENEGRKV